MKSTKILFSVLFTLAFALVLSFTLIAPTAHAAGGDLDPTFGGDGLVNTNLNSTYDLVHDIAVQSDGKIVAVGSTKLVGSDFGMSVARYNPDGSLDTSFSDDGTTVVTILSGRDEAHAVAIRPDGKIVVAGYCTSGSSQLSALARFNPNGALDTTFGGNSNGTVCSDDHIILSDIALQSDGKIVASGYTLKNTASSFSVSRFNEDGSPDLGFGGDGRVSASFFSGLNAANSVALQSDGKIVAAGYARNGSDSNFAAARFLATGDLDPSFGPGTGTITVDVGGEDVANVVKLQPDGKIILAGYFELAGPELTFGLVRLLANGDLDTSFGGTGIVDIDFAESTDLESAFDLVVQPADGKIVAAGYAQGPGVGDTVFALVRLLSNGNEDVTFGGDGKVTHGFGGESASSFALALQSDGKLIAGGQDYFGPTNEFDYALARYLPDDSPACTISFTDVPQGSTFYDYVTCIACRGVIGGYDTGCETGNPCFRPNNNLTRGQLAKIVSNAAGFSENFSTNTFEDVPVGSTFHIFVERLASRAIIGGYACGGVGEPCGSGNKPYFRPNANVTRGQTSKIVAIAVGAPDPPLGQRDFEDVPTTHTFWQWIEALYIGSVISGYPCGGPGEPCGGEQLAYFRPSNNVTRGQSSKIITNSFFPRCEEQASSTK